MSQKSPSPPSIAVNTEDPVALVAVIKKLTFELSKSHEETRKLEDQISCLVSLIKRSWHGDNTATTHLANIIGLSRLNSQGNGESTAFVQKSRAVQNWERLSLKMLDREYTRVEQEIKMKQNLYFRNRELYMEELLNSHDEDMHRVPLHRKTSVPSMEEVDNSFLQQQHHQQHQRIKSAPGNRAFSANRLRQRRQLPMGPRETVVPADVKVADLFFNNSQTENSNSNVSKGITGLYQFSKETHSQKSDSNHSGLSYDNPNRYQKPKLFDIRQTFQQPAHRKPRPLSAAIQRERGRLHSRPKSAGIQTRTVERSVKYESTVPCVTVSKVKPPVPRLVLDESKSEPCAATVTRERNLTYLRNPSASNVHCAQHNINISDTDSSMEEFKKPSVTVRIRSATKRPDCIEAFVEDEQKMKNMEEEFRKTTLQLQKKLGIGDSGLVY